MKSWFLDFGAGSSEGSGVLLNKALEVIGRIFLGDILVR